MRTLLLAAAIGLTAPASLAFAQTASPARPLVEPLPAARQAPATARSANEEARRREDARYKRWDDRMRRATRSLCDRC
ncbi:MAG: hypothetical protein JWQ36_2080 [Enterovirga sp.]|jgi:hypothetical protein|nr:hypothetical protein [Enterovirga sp.]